MGYRIGENVLVDAAPGAGPRIGVGQGWTGLDSAAGGEGIDETVRADALRNRERLVEVAQEAFACRGVETSLEDIAREAGVGIGTLYRRFATREDLIAAVLNERYRRLIAYADRLVEDEPPAAALRDWLTAFVDHLALYRGLSMAVKEAIHDTTTTLGKTCREMMAAGEQLMARGQKTGAFRDDVTFMDVISLCSGIVFAAEHRATKAPDDAPPLDRHLLLDVVLKGIRPD
jgi:AcrR family transcriptional regulator